MLARERPPTHDDLTFRRDWSVWAAWAGVVGGCLALASYGVLMAAALFGGV